MKNGNTAHLLTEINVDVNQLKDAYLGLVNLTGESHVLHSQSDVCQETLS